MGVPSGRIAAALRVTADVATICVLGAAAWIFVSSRSGASRTQTTPSLVGSSFTTILVQDALGATRNLPMATDLPGLVAVFSTTCPVCSTQKPDWEDLAEKAGKLGLGVFAISVGPEAGAATYFDSGTMQVFTAKAPEVASEWRVGLVPYTVLLDASGQVILESAGLMTPSALSRFEAEMEQMSRGMQSR